MAELTSNPLNNPAGNLDTVNRGTSTKSGTERVHGGLGGVLATEMSS